MESHPVGMSQGGGRRYSSAVPIERALAGDWCSGRSSLQDQPVMLVRLDMYIYYSAMQGSPARKGFRVPSKEE